MTLIPQNKAEVVQLILTVLAVTVVFWQGWPYWVFLFGACVGALAMKIPECIEVLDDRKKRKAAP
jgi:hypothetical protein